MSQQIDQLCEELLTKLRLLDDGLNDLKARINDKTQCGEQLVRNHLDVLQKRIENSQAKLAAARSEVTDWLDESHAGVRDKIAGWKVRRETDKLHHHADRAEHYAGAAFEIAGAAIDAAERAALEAWLARKDAISAQIMLATRS